MPWCCNGILAGCAPPNVTHMNTNKMYRNCLDKPDDPPEAVYV